MTHLPPIKQIFWNGGREGGVLPDAGIVLDSGDEVDIITVYLPVLGRGQLTITRSGGFRAEKGYSHDDQLFATALRFLQSARVHTENPDTRYAAKLLVEQVVKAQEQQQGGTLT